MSEEQAERIEPQVSYLTFCCSDEENIFRHYRCGGGLVRVPISALGKLPATVYCEKCRQAFTLEQPVTREIAATEVL